MRRPEKAPDQNYSLSQLYALWEQLGDIPTTHDGPDVDCIEEAFLHFDVGTHREDIWHWFEAQHDRFLVGEVMNGVRHSETVPSPEDQVFDR